MTLREKLEFLQRQGWTIDDLIQLARSLETIVDQIPMEAPKEQTQEQLSITPVELVKGDGVDRKLRYKIQVTLLRLGVSSSSKGYRYLTDAIEWYMQTEREIILSQYVDWLAAKYNDFSRNVIKVLENTIKAAYRKTPVMLQKIFGDKVEQNLKILSVDEFIIGLAKYIKTM